MDGRDHFDESQFDATIFQVNSADFFSSCTLLLTI